MKFGFTLRRLTLTGGERPKAELRFERGLNVISGPSDTGKTYIAQCIDFVMGGGTAPKAIPEATGYGSILLEIESNDERRVYVLERALRGGDIRLATSGENDRIMSGRNQPDGDENISGFLLTLSGLTGRRVRTNKQGKTRSLSFRDVAPLIFVDEESVISADSPILSGQYTTGTTESSVFRLLLTGADDSAVIAKEDPKHAKGRQEGKAEILEVLLEQVREQLAERQDTAGEAEVRDQLTHLESVVEAASAELAAEQGSAVVAEERRRAAWTHLRQAESRSNVLIELQKRFALLQEQYISDLGRLDAMTEAGERLGQMNEERCPVCGSPAEHHDNEHQRQGLAVSDVAESCKAETIKTATLLGDLRSTLTSNAEEIERLNSRRSTLQAELESISSDLKLLLQPKLQGAAQRLRESQARCELRRQRLSLFERKSELERLLAEANAPRKKERVAGPSATVSSSNAEQFSKEVETLLRSWHFPHLDRVTFSEDDQDVVISGRSRGSHGKGVRAITRAAFNLALLRLCNRENRPFPGIVLIDSPLVVYREPDPSEGAFPLEVKEAFYRSTASDFRDSQVIILENDEPPADLAALANCVTFTGTALGRVGLLPLA